MLGVTVHSADRLEGSLLLFPHPVVQVCMSIYLSALCFQLLKVVHQAHTAKVLVITDFPSALSCEKKKCIYKDEEEFFLL